MKGVTFGDWWRATKNHSRSPRGMLQTQLIINAFIVAGCFLGAIQTKLLGGPSGVSFMLFAFGLLQLYSYYLLVNQWRQMRETLRMIKENEEDTTFKMGENNG